MNRTFLARIGYFLARDAFERLREKMDPRRGNGGVFLGLTGIVIKSHGGTDPEGFATAVELGYSMARNRLLETINLGRDRILPHPSCEPGAESRAGGGAVSTIRSVVLGAAGTCPRRFFPTTSCRGWWIRPTSGSGSVPASASAASRLTSEFTSDLGRPCRHARRSTCAGAVARPTIDLVDASRTATPDHYLSGGRGEHRSKLGMKHGVAFDLQAVSPGSCLAADGGGLDESGPGRRKRALVIGAETFSRILDWTDRSTCVLFGGGAGAVVLSADFQPGWR